MKDQKTDLAAIKTANIVYDNTTKNRIAVKITVYSDNAMIFSFFSPNERTIGLKADKTGEALRLYNHIKQSTELKLTNTSEAGKFYHEFYMKGI